MIKEMNIDLKNRHNYKVVLERYDNVNSMINDLQTRKVTSYSFNDKQKEELHKSWDGVGTYQEALDLLHKGYIDKVEEITQSLKNTVEVDGKRIGFKNDVVGFAPIVPLAIQGVPSSMINTCIKKIKSKVVDIYYDMTVSCGTDSEDILEYGKRLLGALLKLELQGYRINLYAVQSYSDRGGVDVLTIKVKDALQPLDLKRVSFPLIHTAFFRVIGFDWYSRCPKATYRGGYGHNIYQELYEGLSEFTEKVFGKNATYISASKMKHETEEHLMEVIKNGSNNN